MLTGITKTMVMSAKIMVKKTVLGGPSGLQDEEVVVEVESPMDTVTEEELYAHCCARVYGLKGVVQSLSVV
jgi:hypothetical protein